ncbi:hypothetical protein HELRODRAFT_190256 [Helobdella robusta]|uniref:Succinate--CoA ligase [GDP-forming] subunit beta, mitochondrial n=1 Tax=Helobdella robusta TaxID=6412 RepID=T1FRT6_HELRO|nr:hypothetical protein HELRODRAFT_190256 [Helobdella robusta]ESO10983.1 hypothetical protein HELRODRAFT_190256 [Helobdella robusta]
MFSKLHSSVKLLCAKNFLRKIPARFLNLHEYQSKGLMEEAGLSVQKFMVAHDLQSAHDIAAKFKVTEYVIKAQVLAGGRGKGVFDTGFKGGVHLTKKSSEVAALVENMLGHKIITKQTPKEGVKVNKVMVAEAMDIKRETYVAIVMDRESSGPIFICSPCGGVDIEDVAATQPEMILKTHVDIWKGLSEDQALEIAKFLKFEGHLLNKAKKELLNLYKLFIKLDATQIEINPFGETTDDRVICFDAKINFDDNAAYRQQEVFKMADHSESDPRELEASQHNLNYIGLHGNIGCMVNGAGLAMATMDMIKLRGGEPANFLDVGGGVNEAQISQAFKILANDKQVKCILVNVFGGIVNCSIVAKGIVNAARTIELKTPLIVRLEGTNVEEARSILSSSGINVINSTDLDDAATKAVASLKIST